jgi:hypothetical protein
MSVKDGIAGNQKRKQLALCCVPLLIDQLAKDQLIYIPSQAVNSKSRLELCTAFNSFVATPTKVAVS